MTDYSKITALYSRLSVGDEDRDGGESNSIQNQKIFLENYARGQHLTNIRHYIDDDESGRFFDRSAYSRMMDDVESGKIGVCIMKDLTRWGRDYRGLGSIDITAAVRSLLFIGKLKDSPTTRVLIHEKSSLAPPGQSLAFSLGDEKGFEWIGAYDITADELLAGTDTAKTESKTAQAQMLILELLADGKRMPSAELEKMVNERGISSRTMRTAKSRIGDRLVTEKDGTAWVCYLRD